VKAKIVIDMPNSCKHCRFNIVSWPDMDGVTTISCLLSKAVQSRDDAIKKLDFSIPSNCPLTLIGGDEE
jgi:hypothetical protein